MAKKKNLKDVSHYGHKPTKKLKKNKPTFLESSDAKVTETGIDKPKKSELVKRTEDNPSDSRLWKFIKYLVDIKDNLMKPIKSDAYYSDNRGEYTLRVCKNPFENKTTLLRVETKSGEIEAIPKFFEKSGMFIAFFLFWGVYRIDAGGELNADSKALRALMKYWPNQNREDTLVFISDLLDFFKSYPSNLNVARLKALVHSVTVPIKLHPQEENKDI